ncbi:MAG TPA: response regulator [Blastocatellia bacterium]|nr:response regulator [Blastocatellia bacterium]
MRNTIVLVISDEPSFVDAVKLVLDDHGYAGIPACTGREALDKAKEISFDLVIADVPLPDVPGLEVLVNLRETYPATPVVITTGDYSKRLGEQALALGAVDVLSQPFSPTTLIGLTERILSSKPAHSEAILRQQ